MTPTTVTSRERSLYSSFSDRALQTRRQELARVQEQLGTGRAVNRASDDPAAFAQGRAMSTLVDRYAQYERSIGAARAWTTQTQSALDGLSELFTQAYEQGVRANNAAMGTEERGIIADRLDSLLVDVVEGLNARSGDEYVFAGSRSTVRPFTLDEAAGTVDYAGNDGDRSRHIGRDQRLTINVSGTTLHELPDGTTLTGALTALSDAVRAGDAEEISTRIGALVDARDHILGRTSEAAATAGRLDLAEVQVREASLVVEGRRSEVEDADIAEAMMHFQQQQTGLQAALQVSASVMKTTLLDYLR